LLKLFALEGLCAPFAEVVEVDQSDRLLLEEIFGRRSLGGKARIRITRRRCEAVHTGPMERERHYEGAAMRGWELERVVAHVKRKL
jgi:hypothetical protein